MRDKKEIRVTFESKVKKDRNYVCSIFDYKEVFTIEHLEGFNLELTNSAIKEYKL